MAQAFINGNRARRISPDDVFKTMGFTSANQFYRIFKRHFGRTVRQNA